MLATFAGIRSAFEKIQVEAAIDGGAIAPGQIARELGLVAPSLEHRAVETTGQQARHRGRAEYDARPRAGGARDLAPQGVELRIGHPVLSVEQDEAIKRSIGPRLQIFREGAVEHLDPVRPGTNGSEV